MQDDIQIELKEGSNLWISEAMCVIWKQKQKGGSYIIGKILGFLVPAKQLITMSACGTNGNSHVHKVVLQALEGLNLNIKRNI